MLIPHMAKTNDSPSTNCVGKFIVSWFILGGAATFAVVVFTAQNQIPGIAYVALWLATAAIFAVAFLGDMNTTQLACPRDQPE